MVDDIKVISRPKVRFYQYSDDAQDELMMPVIVEDCKQRAALRVNGPRIKEIVTLKKPIRVVDATKFASVCDKDTLVITDTSLSNCNIDTSSHYGATPGDIQSVSLSNKNMPKVKSTMILRDANNIRNAKNSCKVSQRDKNLQEDNTKNLQQKGKENKDISLKRSTFSKNINDTSTLNSQHIQSITREKFKFSKSNDHMQKINIRDFKRPKMTKSASSVMKKTRNSMIEREIRSSKPILSYYKTVVKNKMSPVKKIVLRNISGPKIKTSVGPGVFRKEQVDAKTNDTNERHIVASDVAVDDLAQPEFNSIMCTINKLKELEQQKVVTDISHLPSALKSFLNGKISAALDFPLDETIYKNLVDLSIDEKQLPSTITRSKDPEPRQKDIIPKLSDFFIPEDTKEICEAAHVKFRASKIDNNWNAFKISDRILEWKYSIDDMD